MILAIDIGNTTMAYTGLRRKEGEYYVVFNKKVDTIHDKTVSFYRNDIARILKFCGYLVEDFEGVILSSVVPSSSPNFTEALTILFKKPPIIVSIDLDTGLTMDVDAPEKVGHDRLVDSAWAAANYELPAVTVDMGTATTFNVIGKGGVFLGGAIAPGLETGLWALSRRTAQLPEIRQMTPTFSIGKNTVECMEVGSVVGSACLIDGLVKRFEAELGEKVTLVITGWHAKTVEGLCTHDHIFDPDFLPKGLAYLYDRNCQK